LLAAGERSAPRGTLTLSAPPIGGEEILHPIIGEFLEAYPDVSVRILLLDRFVNLIDEGVDLALRVGSLPDSSLVAVKVGSDIRRVIVGAPSYLERHPPIEKPVDLAAHQIIAMTNFGLSSWTFPPTPGTAVPRTVQFAPRIEVNSVRAAVASTIAGLGLTRVYSFHLADKVAGGALKIVLADDEPAPQPVHLVVQPARMSTAKVRAFLDFAVPRLRAQFAQLAAEARQMELRS
jgi:DNA-binding transcriptional LysR family regulator